MSSRRGSGPSCSGEGRRHATSAPEVSLGIGRQVLTGWFIALIALLGEACLSHRARAIHTLFAKQLQLMDSRLWVGRP